jgi:dihydropteroate synthase
MGIVNVTPDSFSDGGEFMSIDSAVTRALSMIADGADIIDIGGESSRPGAESISAKEEMQRILPVIEGIRRESDITISIDTTKSIVAGESLNSGADIINDISAGVFDAEMIPLVARSDAGYIIMHMRGAPQTMQDNPEYQDVVSEVCNFLQERYQCCISAGVNPDKLMIDPGIGFGKTAAHNLELLRNLDVLAKLEAPVLVGVSRKAFVGALGGSAGDAKNPRNRLGASLAAAMYAVEQGASVVRVHDVRETTQALNIMQALRGSDSSRKEALP